MKTFFKMRENYFHIFDFSIKNAVCQHLLRKKLEFSYKYMKKRGFTHENNFHKNGKIAKMRENDEIIFINKKLINFRRL